MKTHEQIHEEICNEPRLSKAVFKPWVGASYESGERIEGKKVLILGESLYHDCAKEGCDSTEKTHRSLTFSVVKHWKDNPHSSRVSSFIPKLFEIEKCDFWERVVFYNYLQNFAGKSARCKREPGLWDDENSVSAFQQVVDVFEPDRILVLGKDTWSNLPSVQLPAGPPILENNFALSSKVGDRHQVDSFAYWYLSRSGHRSLTMPIIHPSAGIFRLDDWQPEVKKWLAFLE